MATKYPLMIFLLLPSPISAFAQSQLGAPSRCPTDPVHIKDLHEERIRSLCAGSIQARAAAESFPNSHPWLKHCRDSLLMARQASLVVFSTSARRSAFNPELPEELNQQEAMDAAAQKLLKAHNYTNISLAALYRSRLKLQKFLGDTQDALKAVKIDVDLARERPGQNGKSESLKKLLTDLDMAGACLDQMKAPLDRNFEDWVKVKRDLLSHNFEKFVESSPSESSRLGQQAVARRKNILLASARKTQREQQYVLDVLTDPSKRDWAYKLAEGCQTNHCDSWAALFSVGGILARTPVVSMVAKTISGGLAGDLAMRQGLSFWEQVREATNSITPFGLDLLDTEIKRIERGEARTYNPT